MAQVQKQQVVVIHGGTTFVNEDEFLSFLKTKEVTLEKLLKNDWKAVLQEKLGDDYQVILPKMPNAQNAKYIEWETWFERIISLLNDNMILVGHSLGAVFLAKYLSKNVYSGSKKIRAVFLLAAPYGDLPTGEYLEHFVITNDLKLFEKQAGKIFLYQSKDDPVVPYAQVEKYVAQLPHATLRVFEDRLHFNQEELPELVSDIQNL